MVCEKDKYLVTPPLSAVKFYKNIKNIQINSATRAIEINFESIEIDMEDPDVIIEKIMKYHGPFSQQLYKQLNILTGHGLLKQPKISLNVPNSSQIERSELVQNALKQNSIVIIYHKSQLCLLKYILSENFVQMLGFEEPIPLI